MEGLLSCEFLVRSWREWKDKGRRHGGGAAVLRVPGRTLEGMGEQGPGARARGKGLLACKLLVRMFRWGTGGWREEGRGRGAAVLQFPVRSLRWGTGKWGRRARGQELLPCKLLVRVFAGGNGGKRQGQWGATAVLQISGEDVEGKKTGGGGRDCCLANSWKVGRLLGD